MEMLFRIQQSYLNESTLNSISMGVFGFLRRNLIQNLSNIKGYLLKSEAMYYLKQKIAMRDEQWTKDYQLQSK